PDPLTLANGKKVKSARVWLNERRPEIVEDFEREVLGRVPSTAPTVAWSVAETREWQVGSQRVIGRQLVGRVDNSAYPAIAVEICMTLVTPADAKGPVPVMIMLGGGLLPDASGAPPSPFGGPPGPNCTPSAPAAQRPAPPAPPASSTPADPPATTQLIAAGWGYASLSPTTVQADNGA